MAARPHRVKIYLSEQHFPCMGARRKPPEAGKPRRVAGTKLGSRLPHTHLHITVSPRCEPVPVRIKPWRNGVPRLNRIIETALYVDDLERARAFYETKLGLEPLLKTATLFTTQVDFTHAGDLKVFVDEEQLAALEEQMSKDGYLQGSRMATAFNMLRASELIWPYVVNNYLKGQVPMPFDLLYWNSDSTRMAAANHSFYLRNCYLNNTLAQGKMELGGKTVSLRDIKIPIYNLATREDHIAPPRSVFLGSQLFGGPVEYVLSGSGHIAGVVNPPVRKKYQYRTGPAPVGDGFDEWLMHAEEHPGSWWPHWQAWVESLDDTRVKARIPGGRRVKPIEDAPGSYVKVMSA